MKPVTTLARFPLEDRSVRTLGFEVLAWIEAYCRQPDGPDAGSAYVMTSEQVNFLLWWYALDDAGRFLYRRGVLRRAKGWGKSPLMGALALAELAGPVRFGGWDAAGNPVGVTHPMPWVVLAGISEQQTSNTMSVVLAMLEGSPAVDDFSLDVGLTRIYSPHGGKLVPITASAPTQEGARYSAAFPDETHWWTETNGGAKLWRVIRRNLAKSRDGSARALESTNAHEPGMESVAEQSYEAWRAMQEGRTRGDGLLYDSREAPGSINLAHPDEVEAGLRSAYGDSTWLDLSRLRDEVYDPATSPEESRRFYFNQITAAADSWVSPAEWDSCCDPELPALQDGDTVTLGFDGSLTDDSTVLTACRVSDGAPFVLGAWEKPAGPAGDGWMVDKTLVRGAVDHAFGRFDVVGFFSDVAYWETDVDAWRDQYGEQLLVRASSKHAVGWDMRGHQMDTTRAAEALNRAIVDGSLRHDGELLLRRHVLNARRRPNRWGVSFGKESRESTLKVDALASMLLARMARQRILADNLVGKRRPKSGRLIGFS